MEELITLEELYQYGIGFLLSGFVLSFIPMMIGAAIDGLIKILKA